MAAQSEREPGVVVMCSVLDPMVQDPPVQDIPIPEQDESLPQTNPEPEMGAAAAEAAVYNTSPSPPHQNLPILAETAHVQPCYSRHGPAICHAGRNQWGYTWNEGRN